MQATDSVIATVCLDKDFYATEFIFSYDTAMFTCEADSDGDGKINGYAFEKAAGEVLATYTLVAKNDLVKATISAFEVTGKVIQYVEQTLSTIENDVADAYQEIKVSLKYTAEIKADYVNGYSLVLVYGEDAGYAYNNQKMFYVDDYEAYAFIVEGAVTEQMIDDVLSKTTNCKVISKSYNLNEDYVLDNKIDLKDATIVYACSALDFSVEVYMEFFLRSDLDNNYKVNILDITLVMENYN